MQEAINVKKHMQSVEKQRETLQEHKDAIVVEDKQARRASEYANRTNSIL